MVPAKDKFTIYCGSMLTRRYRWVRGTNPVDLTGAVIRAQFRRSLKATDALIDISTTNGAITIEGDGWFRVTIRASMTQSIPDTEPFLAVGHLTVALAGSDPVRFLEIDATLMPTAIR